MASGRESLLLSRLSRRSWQLEPGKTAADSHEPCMAGGYPLRLPAVSSALELAPQHLTAPAELSAMSRGERDDECSLHPPPRALHPIYRQVADKYDTTMICRHATEGPQKPPTAAISTVLLDWHSMTHSFTHDTYPQTEVPRPCDLAHAIPSSLTQPSFPPALSAANYFCSQGHYWTILQELYLIRKSQASISTSSYLFQARRSAHPATALLYRRHGISTVVRWSCAHLPSQALQE